MVTLTPPMNIFNASKPLIKYFKIFRKKTIHSFMIHSKKKRTKLVSLYFVYRPKKNASRTDRTNDDEKDDTFVPTYGY